MKKTLNILLCITMISIFGMNAQTKKKVTAVKKTAASKTAPSKTVASETTTPKAISRNQNARKQVSGKVPAGGKREATLTNEAPYNTALGIKFLYGLSLTAKHFIKHNSALEGIFNYHGFGGLGTQLSATVLYEYQRPVAGVAGLRWYLGGGGHFEYFSFDNDQVNATTVFGAVGALGLEYQFAGLPIAISADWQPVILFNGAGFSAENGGVGIKYTF
ncbi:hypothetical protein PBAL39_19829 [Pedobacter sp. BAL39]|uniref:hypothetical protein n=1 Tax=Pedobacter sp. BAL39 TaxID=391596 RepID=UPI000155952E|nr:hypothetical protein [Pedobacter sp. BAL39]EDM36167.1 hypothetical protein PBAL39_19829 [Pedobacter sp. BAL39]